MSKLETNPFTSDHLYLSVFDLFRLLVGKNITISALEIHRSGVIK
jgi:hypothetical protein